jgi:Family of unknown function (DUF5989)
MEVSTPNDFERAAEHYRAPGLAREFFGFLQQNKKWWLLPIILVLLLLGAVIVLSSSVIAPFIYPLF